MVNACLQNSCNVALSAALIKPSRKKPGDDMPHRAFRIEQMFGTNVHRRAPLAQEAEPRDELGRELTLLRETVARNKRELSALQAGGEPRMRRAASELGAAIEGMEKATQTIIDCAESIDESARTLAATTKTGYERSLAHDIQEQTARIYAASNFQDLAGQRIGKAIATLQTVEDEIARLLAQWDEAGAPAPARPAAKTLLSGPRLDGDLGHASQPDIDALFG